MVMNKKERASIVSSKEKKPSQASLLAKVREEALLTPEKALSDLNSRKSGLTAEEVLSSRERFGPNEMAKTKKSSALKRLLLSFATPFTILLLVVAIVSVIVECIPDSQGNMDIVTDSSWWVSPLIIVAMVMLSGIVSFIENSRSQKSSEKLRHFTENTSTVIRDGKVEELANSEIVVGDIVRLGAGDMIPADVRIVEAKDLFLNQSALNGESAPAEKAATASNEEIESLFDIQNLAFSGSSVISGTGLAVVREVGSKTILGSLSKKLAQKRGKTTFEKGVSSIARLLMSFMLVMVPSVFIFRGLAVNYLGDLPAWQKMVTSPENWLIALSFAITVAVGLTPALLPMQVASNLARGAVNMSKRKVIVKDINSIQNFGAMDVLCTDKTGTLTEGNSTLSDYINLEEKSFEPLVQLAYLNAYYQTGIRNQLDRSIIEYLDSKPDDEKALLDRYDRLDEIPFDFDRKMLSILVRDRESGKNIVITKGFTGTVKDKIDRIYVDGTVREASKEDIDAIKNVSEKYAGLGTRVIVVAARYEEKDAISYADEAHLVFLGFITFKDAPKLSAAKAIQELWEKGVRVKVLTGDSLAGSLALMKDTGFKDVQSLSGPKMALMDDEQLAKAVERCDLFVKLSPDDKERIVKALQANDHVVGFMGDGINDAAALRAADIGISFKEATDIAKEAADIILLENDLRVLSEGIDEGRKAYINMMKYLKGQSSSNFGNMISQIVGALWIPFLPMGPIHLILLDLITDVSCACMPFDNVDPHLIKKPLRFDVSEIKWFIFFFGPISSIVDLSAFALLFYFIAPNAPFMGGTIGAYDYSWSLAAEGSVDALRLLSFTAIFQTGFFIESLVTQNVVYLFLRTDKLPLIQSRPSLTFGFSIIVSVLLGFFVIYVPDVQNVFGFASSPDLPWIFIAILVGLLTAYLVLTLITKKLYERKFHKLL